MLETFELESTKISPEVKLSKEENFLKISGRSIVEDPNKFYMPIYEWLEKYVADPNPDTNFQFDLEYFNSSSARQVMKIIIVLEDIVKNNRGTVKVTWLYEEGDDMAKERGEEIKMVSKLDFEIIEYEAEDFDM